MNPVKQFTSPLEGWASAGCWGWQRWYQAETFGTPEDNHLEHLMNQHYCQWCNNMGFEILPWIDWW